MEDLTDRPAGGGRRAGARAGGVVPRARGRPRDAGAQAVILAAAAEVLGELGPAGFTVDAVAARAGCGKATIYRRWPSRAALMLEAVQRMGLDHTDIDSGSIRDDLVSLLVGLATKLTSTPAGRLFVAVVAEAAGNEAMRVFLRGFVEERQAAAAGLVQRAIDRGELPASVDPLQVVEMLGGPLFSRLLTRGEVPDRAFIEWTVDVVVAGLTGGPPTLAAR
jgi:AcrR family transcriptional regulator